MEKLLKELKNQNILYYIFSFSAVVLLVVTIMGTYLYRYYYRTIYADFQASNAEHLQMLTNRHESDIQIINNIAYQIGIADNVTAFMLKDSPEKAIQLERQLHQYMSVSQFFSLLLYYYHEDGYLYSDTTSVEESFFYNNCILENVDGRSFQEEMHLSDRRLRILPEQNFSGRWIQSYLSDTEVVLYMMAIAPQFKETMVFFVTDAYYDSLLPNRAEDFRQDYLLYDGQVIVSRGSMDLSEDDVVRLAEESIEQRQVTIGNKRYLLTARQGDSGIVYCTLQSMDVFYNKILTEQWGILAILILCVFPAGFFITVVSRRLLMRVRHLNQMLDLEEDTGYNLGSIESGIQMLVESREQKEQENRQLRKARFIRSFIRSDFDEPEEVMQAARDVLMEIQNTIYLAVLLGGRSDNDENQIYSQMLNVIEQMAHLDGYGVRLVSKSQSLFVLFAETREDIEETLGRVFVIGKSNYEDFVMASSAYHTLLTEGSIAYLEADTAFDNRFLQDNNKIIRFHEVSQTESVKILSEAYLQNLRHALRNRDKDRVKQTIEDICIKMTKESPSLFTFRLLYNDIIHVLMSEWKGENTGAESFYNVFTLSQCLTVQNFNDLLYEACTKIIDSRPQESSSEVVIAKEATRYMQEHYSDSDLTMSTLAEQLKVSSVTLAVVFKNEMGIRPSDYLANLRMERARELLITTNMLIREISVAVGYEDDHVFTRRFKKYTGKTPGQYREEHA